MKNNLIKSNDLVKEETIFIAKANITLEQGKAFKAEFEFKIEGIENPKEYSGLELTSSEKKISDIPTVPELLNPVAVDELITWERIKNYTIDEGSQEEKVPLFNATYIDWH